MPSLTKVQVLVFLGHRRERYCSIIMKLGLSKTYLLVLQVLAQATDTNWSIKLQLIPNAYHLLDYEQPSAAICDVHDI